MLITILKENKWYVIIYYDKKYASPCNVNKDLSHLAKAKDSGHKAKAKDLSHKAKDLNIGP
jgi:hypothetical protein